jgi:hypothetical protein
VAWNTLLNHDEFDAFAAIGRGRILNPRYQITVKKTQTGTKVSNLRFRCVVEDLYHFNYEDTELPKNAAAVQIGYGRGVPQQSARNYGKIYRSQIQIDEDFANEPFTDADYTYPYP